MQLASSVAYYVCLLSAYLRSAFSLLPSRTPGRPHFSPHPFSFPSLLDPVSAFPLLYPAALFQCTPGVVASVLSAATTASFAFCSRNAGLLRHAFRWKPPSFPSLLIPSLLKTNIRSFAGPTGQHVGQRTERLPPTRRKMPGPSPGPTGACGSG